MDNIEEFLKSMFHYYDIDILLSVEPHIYKYFIDFERIYRYFQQTVETKDIYFLKRNLELVQFQHFRSS